MGYSCLEGKELAMLSHMGQQCNKCWSWAAHIFHGLSVTHGLTCDFSLSYIIFLPKKKKKRKAFMLTGLTFDQFDLMGNVFGFPRGAPDHTPSLPPQLRHNRAHIPKREPSPGPWTPQGPNQTGLSWPNATVHLLPHRKGLDRIGFVGLCGPYNSGQVVGQRNGVAT